ncbi:ankyrin repeat protein [Saudi moumouvirus]|nr:ankyrin repeat protein [Saudi moumouvirus]
MISDKYTSMFLEYNSGQLYPLSLICEPSYTTTTKLMYILFNKNKFPKNLILDYIKDHPRQINKTNINNITPLIFELCQKNNPYIEGGQYNHDVEIFECLLSNGADPNMCFGKFSPLYLCIVNKYNENKYQFLELLLKYGANINHGCINPVLHQIIYQNDYQFAELFIKYGADINAKDNNGKTPLMILLNSKVFDDYDLYDINKKIKNMIKILLVHNCNVFIKDNKGFNIFCQNKIEQDLYDKVLEIEKHKTFIRIITNKIFKRSETILMAPNSLRYNLLLIKWNNYDYEYVKNHYPQIISYFEIYDEKDFHLKIFDALKYLN